MAPGLRLTRGTRKVASVAAIVVAALALLVGRVLLSSREELALGMAAYERGDRQAAVVHLRRAAHWYAPASPYVTQALTELRRIGRQAEMEGQQDLALSAYRAIRTSCLGTRSFYTPHAARLEEADRRIAAILARQEPRPAMDRGKTVAELEREHLELLSTVEEPSPLFSATACLSFLLWIGGAFGFIFRGLDEDLHLRKGPALRWAGIVALGLAVWAASLLLA